MSARTTFNAALFAALALASLAFAAQLTLAGSPVSFYTLDDPYIHLAFARHLAGGHFGVNAGEVANPSSSILWPWLLVPAAWLGVELHAPMAINIAAFLACAWLLVWFADRFAPGPGAGAPLKLLLVFTLVCLNAFGVAFTGMEHTLHATTAIAAALLLATGSHRNWLVAALILCPLVRFEGLAIAAIGVAALVFDRDFGRAAIVAGVLAVVLGVYAWAMDRMGLPPLPGSVLAKSAVSDTLLSSGASLDLASEIADNLRRNTRGGVFAVFATFAALLTYRVLAGAGRVRAVAGLGLVFLALHLGLAGWYDRYQVYATCFAFALCTGLFRAELAALARRLPAVLALSVFVLALGSQEGPRAVAQASRSASNIYRQQHQMHRFAVECWRAPVAANDIGWLTYDNPHYVLDLMGLASEAARQARRGGPARLAELTAERGIEVAMIYESWFRTRLPASWRKVGVLRLDEPRLAAAGDRVAFFATVPGAAPRIGECLAWLARTAPSRVGVEIE
jgi:hypothetical protein